MLTIVDLRLSAALAAQAAPQGSPGGPTAPGIGDCDSVLWVLKLERRCPIQVERKEPSNVNVIACLELQQADCMGAECTPTSPAACRAAAGHTLQYGIDDGANK
jgi:hypothetical protein